MSIITTVKESFEKCNSKDTPYKEDKEDNDRYVYNALDGVD